MAASLLTVAVVMTLVFLVLVRITVARQIQSDLAEDVQRSMVTFHNLESQRSHMLARTAALIADLPSLKALMTAPDAATIIDGGAEFWHVSGSSLFILSDQAGRMVSFYNVGTALQPEDVRLQSADLVQQTNTLGIIRSRGRLFEVLSEPIRFGSRSNGFYLGYVTVGYEVDHDLALQIQQAADAQIVFLDGNAVVATTLRPEVVTAVQQQIQSKAKPGSDTMWTLAGEQFRAASTPLESQGSAGHQPKLIVLKSYDKAAMSLHELNLGIAVIALLGLLTGVFLAISIAARITTPIESLVVGTRRVGSGDFTYEWRESGAKEVRELGQAFHEMQMEVQQTQQDLLKAERMATIGNMASSVSHDLRHYLTSIYANAEFLCSAGLPASEQEMMLAEVRTAVFGMTDLLDSLLLFGRTSMSLHIRRDSLLAVVERTVARVRIHPDARTVEILTTVPSDVEADFDAQELSRAIYNLLLNACHAAKRGSGTQRVWLRVVRAEFQEMIGIVVEDTGPGVPKGIRQTLFEPFVSEGKENGTGLGLSLALRIAQAHHGTLELVSSEAGKTIFRLSFPGSFPVTVAPGIAHFPSETIA